MVCRVTTFAFEGVEAQPVDVQVQMAGGQPAFHVVGLPDKAVGEYPVLFLVNAIESWGHKKLILRCDQEPAIDAAE